MMSGLRRSDICIDKSVKLGEGGTSVVFQGKIGERRVAVKTINKVVLSPEELDSLQEEIIELKQFIGVAFVIQYICDFIADEPYFIVTELLETTLYFLTNTHYLEQNPLINACNRCKLSLSLILALLVDVCKGLCAFHVRNHIHRDLKASNVFVDKNNHCKLGDLGLAKIISSHVSTYFSMVSTSCASIEAVKGTAPYLAPELLSNDPGHVIEYTFSSDMYAMAVMMNEVLCGVLPFPGMTIDECKAAIVAGAKPVMNFRDRFDSSDPNEMAVCIYLEAIISSIWNAATPRDRLSAYELRSKLEQLLDLLGGDPREAASDLRQLSVVSTCVTESSAGPSLSSSSSCVSMTETGVSTVVVQSELQRWFSDTFDEKAIPQSDAEIYVKAMNFGGVRTVDDLLEYINDDPNYLASLKMHYLHHKRVSQALQNKKTKEVTELRIAHLNELSAQKNFFDEQLASLLARHAQELSDLRSQHTSILLERDEKHSAAIQQLRGSHVTELQDTVEKHKSVLSFMDKMKTTRLEEQEALDADKNNSLQFDLSEAISALEEERVKTAQLSDRVTELNKLLLDLTEQHTQALLFLQHEHGKELTNLKTSHADLLKEVVARRLQGHELEQSLAVTLDNLNTTEQSLEDTQEDLRRCQEEFAIYKER